MRVVVGAFRPQILMCNSVISMVVRKIIVGICLVLASKAAFILKYKTVEKISFLSPNSQHSPNITERTTIVGKVHTKLVFIVLQCVKWHLNKFDSETKSRI